MSTVRDHDAARAIAKQQIEMAMREIMNRPWGDTAEGRRSGLAPYLAGRFALDRDLVARFLGDGSPS